MEALFKVFCYAGLALVFLSSAAIISFVCSEVAADRRRRHVEKHGEM